MNDTMKKFGALFCAAIMLFCSGCSADKGNTDLPDTTVDTPSLSDVSSDVDTSDVADVTDLPEFVEDGILNSLNNGIIIDEVSGNVYKTEDIANPISSIIFCADPTGIEYNGRLYVYGTSDHQQYEIKGKGNGSGYEHIKSLVVFSTEDMANWTYHGSIPVGEIAPWIYNSWAPSIVSRVEDDGLTHFYLYFSNNGRGVGVITSTDPVTGWTDPLGEPLIYYGMPGLENCPAPFDPGVCIDDNGVGWLTFGGGTVDYPHSFIPKIVKLGEDMLSFDSEFISLDAPYFNEASELNYIDGVYYYTYCTDWSDHKRDWEYDYLDPAPVCSMAYMTTTTPLVADSWKYQGAYFYNAGENAQGGSGMRYSNNHTHFFEYKGTNYILHHTMLLEELSGATDDFRSLMVDYLPMDKETLTIPITAASKTGVAQIELLDPYLENSGTTMFTSADIEYTDHVDPSSRSIANGAWIYVRRADFGYGASSFIANVKGQGRIEVRLDDLNSEAVAFIEFDNEDYEKVRSNTFAQFDGRNHSIYLVFSGADIELKDWRFTKADEQLRPEEPIDIPKPEIKVSESTLTRTITVTFDANGYDSIPKDKYSELFNLTEMVTSVAPIEDVLHLDITVNASNVESFENQNNAKPSCQLFWNGWWNTHVSTKEFKADGTVTFTADVDPTVVQSVWLLPYALMPDTEINFDITVSVSYIDTSADQGE